MLSHIKALVSPTKQSWGALCPANELATHHPHHYVTALHRQDSEEKQGKPQQQEKRGSKKKTEKNLRGEASHV
jgi:phosphatidylethanolamine-binding protein (PEBP) family uncharacterized protein